MEKHHFLNTWFFIDSLCCVSATDAFHIAGLLSFLSGVKLTVAKGFDEEMYPEYWITPVDQSVTNRALVIPTDK
jgi:hypothetical protein